MAKLLTEDERHLAHALRLAGRGQGWVEPNPMVGCVIVRDGQVIAEGHHRRFGGPHAEIDALRRCSGSPRGATVFVTLEPCCHQGKTPPCTDALITAGVSRVVAPLADPNPLVGGRGFRELRRAGLRVDVGLLAEQARVLNAPYFKVVEQRRPWVILKWAQSLDGRIATWTGDSKWITGDACRAHAHRTRGRVDAIVVGIGTVLRDDPLLTCRVGRPRRTAVRVVLDTQLRIPQRSQLVRTARAVPTWVFCSTAASPKRMRLLDQAGCRVLPVRRTHGRPSLPTVLDTLRDERQATNVLVEGGGYLLGSFFDQRLADEYHVYFAPLLIGGDEAILPLTSGGAAHVASALHLTDPIRFERLGKDHLVTARSPRPTT